MRLTDRFLRAKHWQIFILIFGLPFFIEMIFMSFSLSNFANNQVPDPESFSKVMSIFPVVIILFAWPLFAWFWSIGIGLQKKIPAHIKMKTRTFKVFFFIPIIYISLLLILMTSVFMNLPYFFNEQSEREMVSIAAVFLVIIPLHLFSMFCMFYCIYFVAKTYKTVEMQRETSFSDFAGEFFLFWFSFVGVWFVQPKINKMVDMETESQSDIF